jgi:predicted proteasome-type protease
VSFLFGGQIMGERMRLFMIYSAGNFIECTVDTPYLQIGEHKYGKPVLDRAINYEMDIYDALKVGLISIDSTLRSNLSVGLPIDLMVLRRDTCDPELIYRIEPGEPYFTDLRETSRRRNSTNGSTRSRRGNCMIFADQWRRGWPSMAKRPVSNSGSQVSKISGRK